MGFMAFLLVITLKNAVHGIFQLASARYTPAPGSMNPAIDFEAPHARARPGGR